MLNDGLFSQDLLHFDNLIDAIKHVSQSRIHSMDDINLMPISGGDINESSLAILPNGMTVFVKQNSIDNFALLQAEVIGLQAIEATGARTCQPQAYGIDTALNSSFLILSAIYNGSPIFLNNAKVETGWIDLAKQLVTLHQAQPPQPLISHPLEQPPIPQLMQQPSMQVSHKTEDKAYQAGWHKDNFIGYSVQKNEWANDWHEFFATYRLEYQTKLAFDNGYLDNRIIRQIEYIKHHLTDYLPSYTLKDEQGQVRPSLLHGDLWSGNVLIGNETTNRDDIFGYLIDPAVYVGHPEADLAMTHMFGDFDRIFYDTYNDHLPIISGFTERVDIYNLYHYLNHLNLFGTAYFDSVKRIAACFG